MTNTILKMMNGNGQRVYCIIRKDADLTEELKKVFSVSDGYGFTVEVNEAAVAIKDYFHGENAATFKILSIEDTDEELMYYVKTIKD